MEATVLFEKTAEEILHGDRGILDGLTAHERKTVIEWFIEAVSDDAGHSPIHDVLWEIDYHRKPVDIEQFINDDYYFGKSCSELHPLWKRDICTAFAPGSPIFEWIFTGAVGVGKTTVAMASLAYKLHCISCLRDPAKYYGLLPDSLIVFGVYSITKRQVADAGYFKLRGFIDSSPYFTYEFPRSKKIDSQIVFLHKNIRVVPGSQELHALGLDLFSYCLSKNHYVWTEDGPTRITEMLDIAKRIWTEDSNGWYLTEPLKAEITGYEPVIPIELFNGQRLEPTANQRFKVRRAEGVVWVRTDKLRIGDLILTPGFSCAGYLAGVQTQAKAGGTFESKEAGDKSASQTMRNRFGEAGNRPVAESSAVHRATRRHAQDNLAVLVSVYQEAQIDVQTAEVVAIGEPLEPQFVYDIVEVPRTHLFLTGLNPTKNPAIAHNCMDEVNFMRSKENKEVGRMTGQAYDLYNATYTRLQSRFLRPGGTLPGIMLLLSSRKAQTSFLEEHLKIVGKRDSTYISDYKLWETKPAHRFTMPRFNVEVGDRLSQSRILADDEVPRKTARIVEVPGEFKPNFEEDIDQALRDIAGVATFNISPLIRDRQSVFDAIRVDLTHPFTRRDAILDIEDDILLSEYYKTDVACRVQNSTWVPLLNPGCPRFIHVDLALTGDAAGIAMGHVSGTKRLKKTNMDGTVEIKDDPFILMDFMLRISRPPGGEIDLSKIRAFVLYLTTLYNVVRVTFDTYQSSDSIQILKKKGVEAGHLSVDRNDEAYRLLRSALFDRRIAMYEYGTFIDEVLDLERDANRRKVDHPTRASKGGKGSKDVSDAVAGVVYHCVYDSRAREPLIQPSDAVSLKEVTDGLPPLPPTPEPTHETIPSPTTKKRIAGEMMDWEKLRENIDA